MGIILVWLLAVEYLGFVILPVVYLLFSRLPDRGITLSKIIGLLIASYMLWIVGLRGFVISPRFTILGILFGITLISLIIASRHGKDMISFLRKEKVYLIVGELVFLGVFFIWIAIITQEPAINHTEQLMDFGFLNAILNSDRFPPEDIWLAGHSISYYHFGHLMMGTLTILSGLTSNFTYNLSLALIPALVSLGSYGIIYNLVRLSGSGRRGAMLYALSGPILVGLTGNLVGVLHFVEAWGWGSDQFWGWVNIRNLPGELLGNGGLFPQYSNWWWHSTRVIDTIRDGKSLDFTITEFPFFSFLLGDLHAHVMSLPFLLLNLSLILNLFLCRDRFGLRWLRDHPFESLMLSFSLGSLAFINFWDIPVMAACLTVILFVSAFRHGCDRPYTAIRSTISMILPIFSIAILMFVPFHLGLEGQVSGVLPLQDVSTRPFFFILIWGPFLAIALLILMKQGWSLPRQRSEFRSGVLLIITLVCFPMLLWAIWISISIWSYEELSSILSVVLSRFIKVAPLMALVGFALYSAIIRVKEGLIGLAFCLSLIALGFFLLIGVELFYVEDFLPLRMNTVFKVYYQVWLLLALACSFGIYYWFSQQLSPTILPRLFRSTSGLLCSMLVVAMFYYPLGATLDRINNSDSHPTLDGLAFIKKVSIGEYDAISRLRDHAVKGRIVEAVGEDYSEYGRISASTGLPSLLNWPGHELQWRGSYVKLRGRAEAVAEIYQTRDLGRARQLLSKYDVRYVYVGERERVKYGAGGLSKFPEIMTVYFQRDDVIVYEYSGS